MGRRQRLQTGQARLVTSYPQTLSCCKLKVTTGSLNNTENGGNCTNEVCHLILGSAPESPSFW